MIEKPVSGNVFKSIGYTEYLTTTKPETDIECF